MPSAVICVAACCAGEWQEVLFGLPGGARSLLYSIRGDLYSLCILEAFVTVLLCCYYLLL